MSSSFFKPFYYFLIILVILILFISCFFGPVILESSGIPNNPIFSVDLSDDYVWPTPGYTTITSPFGRRSSPTAGASSYHKGMDIGAPKGSNLIAVCDGKITYTGFLGGGGYTITLSVNNMKITYCHVSPTFIVKTGDNVKKGMVIGYVGPKNVYGVPDNPYKDSNGNPTNGATTGPHLHLGVRVDGKYINPMTLFKK